MFLTRRQAQMAICALVLLLSVGVSVTAAQDCSAAPPQRAVTDNEVNRVSKNLYCPVCENVPLEVCPTEACQRWREQVRDLLARGCTDKEVEQYFIERFGPKTVGTPSDPVTHFLTVTLPYALIGLIGLVIVTLLLRWRANRPSEAARAAATPPQVPPDDYRAQLEEELRERF